MRILIINSGSSSIKFQLIEMPSETVLCKGIVERIGSKKARVHYKNGIKEFEEVKAIEDHSAGLSIITDMLTNPENGVIKHPDEIAVVGHRVVHGGKNFDKPTKITPKVLRSIKRLSPLAPLHNPANVLGIKTASRIFTNADQVAVFDTAFHQTIPEKAHRYAIPKDLADSHSLRVYGFHGTSHKYVSEKANMHLKTGNSKLISIHLGNGCSMTAVQNGKSIDHSLGFGPSNGLIMGTRSGDIDQSVIFFLMDSFGQSSKQINKTLQKKSGLLGLTGHSDMRDIQKGADNGNADCILALEMVAYRIQKYLGSYAAAMNGLDAVIFTAGIGENSAELRKRVCQEMDFFGISLDDSLNSALKFDSGVAEIQSDGSKVKILVIPTNEELEIARQSYFLNKDK
ncbi:acetate/propionate family kinase [Poritiphilus flavus]|uniref:Acetate kinase n=1 Tax=Poritiphilus flavus TaxID=2697053 RepID=A0A6L9EHD4_9FLAO|nr:acetate kinase [Poritiphilus flavus]NAS13649.1 acetate/propionate family kinase [Poritiphilus flavus]